MTERSGRVHSIRLHLCHYCEESTPSSYLHDNRIFVFGFRLGCYFEPKAYHSKKSAENRVENECILTDWPDLPLLCQICDEYLRGKGRYYGHW